MRKTFIITGFVLMAFLVEYCAAESFGNWSVPNLSVLLIVFFNLYFGIRYGLLTAMLAGLLKDSYSTHLFGAHMFSFVLCAYMTTVLKRFIYHMGSSFSRMAMIAFVITLNILTLYCLHKMFGPVRLDEVLVYVLIPELFLTLMITPFVFEYLKRCVSKLFV